MNANLEKDGHPYTCLASFAFDLSRTWGRDDGPSMALRAKRTFKTVVASPVARGKSQPHARLREPEPVPRGAPKTVRSTKLQYASATSGRSADIRRVTRISGPNSDRAAVRLTIM